MAASALAEAFARLSTSDSRRNALETLSRELTPHEWRFVKSLASKQTFHLDIIGRLPVELVAHVFSYLDTSTPWRLQRVSRSWYARLQSSTVLKHNLDSWYHGAVHLQGADLDFCRRKAQSAHAFRNGPRSAQPDSSFRITASLGLTQLLAGDNLIWLDENHHQVRALNTRSWTLQTFHGHARERIRHVNASGELLVFTTHTTAYVANLNSPGPLRRFRVSSAKLLSVITCRERTVACAGYLDDGILVYVWNFDTQQGRSFNISYNDPLFSGYQLDPAAAARPEIGLLLQPDRDTIVLCMLDNVVSFHAPRRPRLLYRRFTYAGECLQSAEHTFDKHDHDQLPSSNGRALRFVPASHHDLFMLQGKSTLPVQFDESRFASTSPGYPVLDPTSPRQHIVWWKDTFFEAGSNERIVVHRGTSCNPRNDPLISHNRSQPTQMEAGDPKDLLINDMYIVRPYCDSFYVFCYDHTVPLPKKEGVLNGLELWEVTETIRKPEPTIVTT